MRRIAGAAIAAAVTLGLLAAPSTMAQDREMTRGEAELAKILEGRVAGEPESCLRTFRSRSFKVIDETALVYEKGDTIWVNRTRNPESIDDNDILVIDRLNNSQICRIDRITLRDRYSQIFSGVLFLDEFVPYRRAGS